jgi:hypothetical protein
VNPEDFGLHVFLGAAQEVDASTIPDEEGFAACSDSLPCSPSSHTVKWVMQ